MSLKISKRDALCFVLLLAPLEPRYFETNTMVHRVYTIILFFSAAYLCICYLKNKAALKLVTAIVMLLQAWILVSTIINHGLINSTVFKLMKLFVLCLTIDLYSNDISRLIKCLMLHFEIYVYSNFISVIMFPNGLISRQSIAYEGSATAEWVLGWHHYFKVWFMPALLIAWLYRDYYKKSKRCYILTLVIIVTESFWGASTGLTGVIFYLLLLLIPWIKKVLTPIRAAVLAGFLIISIVFVQRYNYLSFILRDLYSDNLTFSGRVTIWRAAINAFERSPLIGYGVRAGTTDIVNILGVGAWATHCHNQILQIMFEGGVIALILFLILVTVNIKCCIKAWKIENTNVSRICLYALFVYLIIGITEQYEYVPMYLILIFPFYICRDKLQSKVGNLAIK